MKFFKKVVMGLLLGVSGGIGFSSAVAAPLPERQAELCMIGDSITWAGEGDCFRRELLKWLPDLAFVGTHSAKYGYSHAGEGGNTTGAILQRIDKPLRVPDSANYHVLCGINDAAATRRTEEVSSNAVQIAQRIFTIIDHLQQRSCTKQIFVGTILPCFLDTKGDEKKAQLVKWRDQTGQAVNVILRREIPRRYAGKNVTLIEYEKPLRAIPDWEHLIYLHPTPAGYARVAALAAPVLKNKLHYTARPAGKCGVAVVNLYDSARSRTQALIPGWYTLSFQVKKVAGEQLQLELTAAPDAGVKLASRFQKQLNVKVRSGQRLSCQFMTGYEGYGYSETPIKIRALNGEIGEIMLEKMRPHGCASRYGEKRFIDTQTPWCPGEKLEALR